ncbi:hypothetical protein DY000_02053613 [Brassica cretica]|uniref:Uncharacterized protein n=1 Tax=Brassica cretica TaxID=69181 RepID=A0ABQ7AG97_BRACR|nr:hypothetical protein DY000_02053613 [Brassica cretica]
MALLELRWIERIVKIYGMALDIAMTRTLKSEEYAPDMGTCLFKDLIGRWFIRNKVSHFQLLGWSEFARTKDHLICKWHNCYI